MRWETNLEERVPSHNSEETLEALAAGLNNFVRETIGEDLSRKRGNIYASRFPFQDIAEGFKVAITASYGRVAQLECWDVCLWIADW